MIFTHSPPLPDVDVKSKEDKGTEFEIQIPIRIKNLQLEGVQKSWLHYF